MYLTDIVDALQELTNYRTDDHSIAGEAMEEIKKLRAENDALAHDYKLALEEYDKFLKKKLVCRHCTHSFVAVNAVQVNGYVYCSEECAAPYKIGG